MTGALRIISAGARTLVQDLGFRNARSMGVPAGGVLDVVALRLVNALLGNPAGTEALEFALSAPRLRAEGGPVWVAICGGQGGRVRASDGTERTVPAPQEAACGGKQTAGATRCGVPTQRG